jgi:hypothetical protein
LRLRARFPIGDAVAGEPRTFEALIIPDEAAALGGVEILRAAIIEGQLHVTLRRTFPEPEPWGGLLSEVARRVARAYCVGADRDESEVILRIHSSFMAKGPKKKSARPSRSRKSAKKRARRRR